MGSRGAILSWSSYHTQQPRQSAALHTERLQLSLAALPLQGHELHSLITLVMPPLPVHEGGNGMRGCHCWPHSQHPQSLQQATLPIPAAAAHPAGIPHRRPQRQGGASMNQCPWQTRATGAAKGTQCRQGGRAAPAATTTAPAGYQETICKAQPSCGVKT